MIAITASLNASSRVVVIFSPGTTGKVAWHTGDPAHPRFRREINPGLSSDLIS